LKTFLGGDPAASLGASSTLRSGKYIPLRNSQHQNFPTHPPSHTLDYNMHGEMRDMNRQPSCNTNIDPDAEDLLELSASNVENQTAQRQHMSNVTNDQDIDTFQNVRGHNGVDEGARAQSKDI
jgi:hypothetical protein